MFLETGTVIYHTGENNGAARSEWAACPIPVECGRVTMCQRGIFWGLYLDGLEGDVDLYAFFSVSGHIYAILPAVLAKTFLLFHCFAMPGVLS